MLIIVFCFFVFFFITSGQYVPEMNATLGTNFFDQDFKMLKVLVRGSEPVEIRTSPVLVLAFELPAMTEDEFFGDSLVQNLAIFLKVPADMIRITSIIREDGGARRRKRSSGLKVEIEISKPPVQQTTNTTNGMWEKTSHVYAASERQTCNASLFPSSSQMRKTSHCCQTLLIIWVRRRFLEISVSPSASTCRRWASSHHRLHHQTPSGMR